MFRDSSCVFSRVRDLSLGYFNDRLNECEINLESEEENVNKLITPKEDLETTKEELVLLKVIIV